MEWRMRPNLNNLHLVQQQHLMSCIKRKMRMEKKPSCLPIPILTMASMKSKQYAVRGYARRGWPETANTWEPLGNLQSVPDLIDAFEESLLKSGKHHKRKRKHADVVQLTQLKKRSERSTTSYSLRHFPPQVPTLTNDYDPKLSELKEAPTNTGVQLDNLAIHFQHPIPSRGAKRRKSASSVKRFKRDPDAAAIQPIAAPIHMPDATNTACNIVKIIKPIGYSASLSDNMHDVLVTFMAMRSDGTEVMVDNRYLKAYNPLLLINFYEMHLRYTPTA
ncbi:hypothetical protein AAZV13_06G001700 [Glycine max]